MLLPSDKSKGIFKRALKTITNSNLCKYTWCLNDSLVWFRSLDASWIKNTQKNILHSSKLLSLITFKFESWFLTVSLNIWEPQEQIHDMSFKHFWACYMAKSYTFCVETVLSENQISSLQISYSKINKIRI